MPSLRELWQRVEERDRGISQSLYDVVERLIEIVEPEAVQAYTELTEAKAEIERLRRDCAYLRKRRGDALDRLVDARRELAAATKKLESHTKSANADAEIGRLVRGMQPLSRLTRGYNRAYWADSAVRQEPWKSFGGTSTDPSKPLRAVQEVSDDEA